MDDFFFFCDIYHQCYNNYLLNKLKINNEKENSDKEEKIKNK